MIMLTAFINARHDISIAPISISRIDIGKIYHTVFGIENIGKSGIGPPLESIQIYIYI